MSIADFWIEDVRAAGEADSGIVSRVAQALRATPAQTDALAVIHGEDGGLYAVGLHTASRLAAIREVYQGTLGRLDRLERLGRIVVWDETDLRRMVDEFPAAEYALTVLAEVARVRGEGEVQQ